MPSVLFVQSFLCSNYWSILAKNRWNEWNTTKSRYTSVQISSSTLEHGCRSEMSWHEGAGRSRGWSRTSGLKMLLGLGWVKSSKLGETETFPLIVKLCLEMSNKIISNISNPGLCLKYNLVKECPHISHRVTLNIKYYINQNNSNFERRNIAIIKKILSAISCIDVWSCAYLLRCG